MAQSTGFYDKPKVDSLIQSETTRAQTAEQNLQNQIAGMANLGRHVATVDNAFTKTPMMKPDGTMQTTAEANNNTILPINISELTIFVTVNDFAKVRSDETRNNMSTLYYISAIDGDTGNISWTYDFTYDTDISGKADIYHTTETITTWNHMPIFSFTEGQTIPNGGILTFPITPIQNRTTGDFMGMGFNVNNVLFMLIYQVTGQNAGDFYIMNSTSGDTTNIYNFATDQWLISEFVFPVGATYVAPIQIVGTPQSSLSEVMYSISTTQTVEISADCEYNFNLIQELRNQQTQAVESVNTLSGETLLTVNNTDPHNPQIGSSATLRNAVTLANSAIQPSAIAGLKSRRYATFVVGTTQSGHTTNEVDYLCTGTNDDVQIDAALSALPSSGGEIVILEGTYNITAPIDMYMDVVKLRGMGKSTILARRYNSNSANNGLINVTGYNCTVSDLTIDGNKQTYPGAGCNAINTFAASAAVTNNRFSNTMCINNAAAGIRLSASNVTVDGNICSNNTNGIYSAARAVITVHMNTCNGNTSNGIWASGGTQLKISNNTCNDNDTGILIEDSSISDIAGNTCIRGIGNPSDYSSTQSTIRNTGTTNQSCLISGNIIPGKDVEDGNASSNNTIVNNIWS